jgi:tetratricopeptide (TPR) repeat protein
MDPDVARTIDDAVAAARANPRSAEAFGRLGRIYHANEFYDLGAQCYAIAAGLDPATPDWPYYLGVLAAERGRSDEAEARFREVIRLTPDDAPTWARLGDLHLVRGEREEAAAAYGRYLALEPGGPWGLVGLGKIARHSGRFEEAAELLERALDAEPEHRQAAYLLAVTYRDLGRPQDADELFARFAETHTSFAAPDPLMEIVEQEATGTFGLMRKANALLQAGRHEEAEALYWEILSRRPDEYTAIVNLAQACLMQRRFDQALALWERAVELRPVEPHGHYGLALSLMATSRFAAAESELNEVLRLDADHAGARQQLQKLHDERGARRVGP